jgi:DNA primase
VARIKESSFEEVKARASIVDVVSGRTQLRKSGARFVGLCPFHSERTPSFYVSPDRGRYTCFGCGANGDAIEFVRETEGLDFVGAVETLAERFGVQLEYEESSPEEDARRRTRERLFALLEQATGFYERYLWEAKAGEEVREYLASRGLGEEVCREFRLGLAPAQPLLTPKAREKGFTLDELRAAGLVNRRGNDYFSYRLLFPLADARGRVRGFQARRLREDDPLRAKYVNSPEGELFRKGDLLYGLDRARTAIAKTDRAVVVEGNTDVLALRQAGFEPVVASMGTALTERQLKELARLTHRIVLCFDGDAAGEAATLRGMELATAEGFEVRVVALPDGVDPADAADAFPDLLPAARPYAVHRVLVAIDAAPDRQGAYEEVKALLDRLPDSPDRQEAWRLANDKLGMTVQIRRAVASTSAGAGAVSPKLLEAGDRLERDLLAACVAHPPLVRVLGELSAEHFDSELHRRIRAHLVAGGSAPAELEPVLAELDVRAAAGGIDEETGRELVLRLRERRLQRELATADLDRTLELQAALEKVRVALRGLA